nr:VOC family protein [Flavobacterium sp. ASV13]
MKVSFWFYTNNLHTSFDFYQKVFNLKKDNLTDKSRAFIVLIGNYTEMKMAQSDKPVVASNIEINEADVDNIYKTLKNNQIFETDESDVEKMALGSFSGPWEYPGGNALFLKDPDGHFISFAEW